MLGLRSIRRSTTGGTMLLCLAGAALWPSNSRACEPPEPPRPFEAEGLQVIGQLVPVDGALMFRWQCRGPCTVEQIGTELQVAALDPNTEQGVPVAGKVTRRGVDRDGVGWGLWQASAGLVEGQHSVVAPGSQRQPLVTVVRSLGFDPRRLFVRGVVAPRARAVGEQVCCDHRGEVDSCSAGHSCFTREQQDQALLFLEFVPFPSGRDQWLYKTTFRADDQPPVVFEPQPLPVDHFAFEQPATNYCYKLEAERIRDGELVLIAEECVSHELGTLTRRPSNAVEEALGLIDCRAAPEGYEAAWKGAKKTLQSAGLFPEEEDEFEEPADDADSDEAVTSDAASGDDAESGAESVRASADGGCQLNRGRRSGVGAFLASLLLLGIAARKRTS